MATLIPLTGTTSFDSAGKRRLAGRLGPMLSGNSLWHNVRAGPKKPASCGREGQALIIKLPTLRDEGFAIADHLASTLAQCKPPHPVRKRSGDYNAGADAIQIMAMKISKGLEFPWWRYPAWGTYLRLGRMRRKRCGCFMWRRQGLRRGW